MQQKTTTLAFATPGRGLTDITPDVQRWAEAQGLQTGLLTLWLQHTSASLLVQENADPDVSGGIAAADTAAGWFSICSESDSHQPRRTP